MNKKPLTKKEKKPLTKKEKKLLTKKVIEFRNTQVKKYKIGKKRFTRNKYNKKYW